uniref:Uncharacterized protein n=1 Tax=Arundo donax TaxID=35708 RepID=A0A0A9GPT6_ARUDO
MGRKPVELLLPCVVQQNTDTLSLSFQP